MRATRTAPKTKKNSVYSSRSEYRPAYRTSTRKKTRLPTMSITSAGLAAVTA